MEEKRNYLQQELESITNRVLELEEYLYKNKDIAEDFKSFLIWAGYDVEHFGSCYPLILYGIKNIINPN